MSTISPYLDNLSPWIPVIKYKHLLFDTDAIISILEYDALSLCDKLKDQGVIFCLIHPIYIELLKTDNLSKRIERQTFIDDYDFQFLPLTSKEMDKAKDIQSYLLTSKSYTASPTDLYLGGRLCTLSPKNSSENIYLITSNLADFPHPLYIRKSGIVLQNNKSSKILHLLQINIIELNKITFKQEG